MFERRVNARTIAFVVFVSALAYTTFFTGYLAKSVAQDKDDYSGFTPHKDTSGFRAPWSIAVEHPVVDHVDHTANYIPQDDKHRIIYSRTTTDRKYFQVDFAGVEAYNVNIIPHPSKKNKWIVVAQSVEYRDDIGSSEQIACIAHFVDGVLHCANWPTALPIATSILGKCHDEWAYTNMRHGPRDARVFYGPQQPYIIYGSQSYITCLGLWVQNLWMLLDGAAHPDEGFARSLTLLQRPEPFRQIEKNYFLFWDNASQVHASYDIYPKRAYAQLKYDGSVNTGLWGSKPIDLAESVAEKDQVCIDKHFPKVEPDSEQGIHQGTNSLSITMCKRSDPRCIKTDDNTFILHIMQHKDFRDYHGIYEPYPVLFKGHSPFELHAVAQRPLFYHGIRELTDISQSRIYKENKDWPMPHGHAEMFYTTSISWKDAQQTYHGYLDDVLFIGFGIEDSRAGAIDVLASDILQDLAYC